MKEHTVYRVSKAIDCPAIAGRAVVFIGYLDRPFDIRRAIVRLVARPGQQETEWLVNPHYVLPL